MCPLRVRFEVLVQIPDGLNEIHLGLTDDAFLVHAGSVLWDCLSFIDDDTVAAVEALGGVSAIAISHPHFYATCVEWSRAFGGVPVFLHADDRDPQRRAISPDGRNLVYCRSNGGASLWILTVGANESQ